MKDLNKVKLANQIKRLCEKQYRKGFQQGYYSCMNQELSKNEVNNFRYHGEDNGYKKVINPHSGRKEDIVSILIAESRMDDMSELINLLYERK